MYNRDNRLKVERDEAKHAAAAAEARQKHQAAEAQYRHQLLLKRARERNGTALTADAATESEKGFLNNTSNPEVAQQQQDIGAVDEPPPKRRKATTSKEAPKEQEQEIQPHSRNQEHVVQPKSEHINFWAEQECKAQHPETEVRQCLESTAPVDSQPCWRAIRAILKLWWFGDEIIMDSSGLPFRLQGLGFLGP